VPNAHSWRRWPIAAVIKAGGSRPQAAIPSSTRGTLSCQHNLLAGQREVGALELRNGRVQLNRPGIVTSVATARVEHSTESRESPRAPARCAAALASVLGPTDTATISVATSFSSSRTASSTRSPEKG
jgi:hypothetical protein